MNANLSFEEKMTLLEGIALLTAKLELHKIEMTEAENLVVEQSLSVIGMLDA